MITFAVRGKKKKIETGKRKKKTQILSGVIWLEKFPERS